jgi:hypothetical protein
VKRGHMSEYFSGVAAKNISAVEADFFRSNQHEFNGVQALKKILGNAKARLPGRILYLKDEQEVPTASSVELTWYDAREQHATRSEFRLYFPDNASSSLARAGDLLVIGRRTDGSVLVILCESGSTAANQVCWLFGLDGFSDEEYAVRESLASSEIAWVANYVLEALGISLISTEDRYLEDMLRMFSGKFPPTRAFSAYARATLPDVDPKSGADAALVAWMEQEEALFRSFEKYLIKAKLKSGFGDDVDGFISYSLSVQNRRKSRVGLALENHLEQVFASNGLRYSRT